MPHFSGFGCPEADLDFFVLHMNSPPFVVLPLVVTSPSKMQSRARW